jgi:hypothetical protein
VGGVVPAPRRARDPAARTDAARALDVGRRGRGGRSWIERSIGGGRTRATGARTKILAGLSACRRAALARWVGRADRAERGAAKRARALPVPKRRQDPRGDAAACASSRQRDSSQTPGSRYCAPSSCAATRSTPRDGSRSASTRAGPWSPTVRRGSKPSSPRDFHKPRIPDSLLAPAAVLAGLFV